MNKNNIYRSVWSITLTIGVVYFLFSQWHTCNNDDQWNSAGDNKAAKAQDSIIVEEKQRGAHVFGIMDNTNFQPLSEKNLTWITMVPWGFQDDYDSPIVTHHNGDSAYILRYDSSWVHRIELVRAAGFKVFVKPHLWVEAPTDGKWRADIFPTNDENWELWKKSYRNFIFRYAKVAERANAEMFCIGAEFSRLAIEKPDFWSDLIPDIRSIYSGRITYAANWYEEFEKITFWDDLDYIGIQAYFPLVENEYPTIQEISTGWNNYLPRMESVHMKFNRKILFTEMGYKSTADSAIKPWEWAEHASDDNKAVSNQTQANCYEAFFNTVWQNEWFAGVHIWQLRTDHVEGRGRSNVDFTPQGKPAENIIAVGFE